MSDKSNKYGYVGVDIPAQSFGANKGVFNPAEINDLVANNQWTTFGQLELIETQSITSSTASMIFSSIQESTYNVHFLTFHNFKPTANTPRLVLRFFESGVEETANVYQYANQQGRAEGTFSEAKSTANNYIHLGGNQDSAGQDISNGYIYIYNAGDSSKYTFTTQQITELYFSSDYYQMYFGSGVLPQTSVVNQIKLFPTTDNIAKLTASLYGIRYS
jgi:hypothetical protein